MPDETSPRRSHELDPQRAANLAENPHAGQGMVMLDIGDDVGAIVLHLPASLEGAEVEIEPGDKQSLPAPGKLPQTHDHPHTHGHAHTLGHPHRPHVAVVGRPVEGRLDFSAVFPSLAEGTYALFVPGAAAALRLEVLGGRVTEADWPGEAGKTMPSGLG